MDARRDSAIWGIYKNIESFTHHFNPTNIDAANVLTDYLKIYGTATVVATSSLPAETAIVTSLVDDLTSKPNLTAAIATLNLGGWITELTDANIALDAKYLERTIELGSANPNSIKDKRLEAMTLYYALRDMLNGQCIVAKGAEPFTSTINELNALIDQYNTLLNNRAAVSAKAKKEEEKPS